MKKLLLILTALILVNTNIIFAQATSNPDLALLNLNYQPKETVTENFTPAADAKRSELKLFKSKTKASANFSRQFKTSASVRWTFEKNFIMAEFMENDIRRRIFYDRSGHWMHDLTYLFAKDLPTYITADIKKSFPEYNIRYGILINKPVSKTYIITLEGHSSFLHVTCGTGGTYVLETLTKTTD